MADRLPARAASSRPAPTGPDDLDGWTAEDLTAWAPDAIRAVVVAEQRTEEMRVSVGLVLYRLRVLLGDGDYGHAAADIAGAAGVTFRTLTTWRELAERHFQLAPPSVRTVARRAREAPTPPLPLTSEALPKSAAKVGGGPLPPVVAPQPVAPLPQPVTQTDYRRLVGLIITAGPEALRRSVDAVELHRARRVLAEATAIPADTAAASSPAAPSGDRCSCDKPVISKIVSNLCTACGKRRPG